MDKNGQKRHVGVALAPPVRGRPNDLANGQSDCPKAGATRTSPWGLPRASYLRGVTRSGWNSRSTWSHISTP